ncbi:hypothetical protein [Ectothiorhodospira variabilis]|uniref:hypothetical protein n=1 Tax=Ectothiorhodospira variabilis TaxID=505694 RepID=UPI001EFA4EEF|nr:hypothetical protein [Ectothiorhodospira variabilis]MCG5495840.1 hypothetical protein [Ectothiorhodospira variabilis]MCG5498950.1 hypothetical protein [Ectothiorhodospira variabilis]MCG5504541.1 hypothetical protein [Ectothiorhodospira variabilis]MCG5507752.1 hypothetical protein [Ectothiorhodospira variabilis]
MRMLVAVTVLPMMLLSGCTSTITDVDEGPAPGVHVRHPDAPSARINMNSVAIIDKNLQSSASRRTVTDAPDWLSIFRNDRQENTHLSKIAVERTNSRRTPTDTLEVWATFRNRTDSPLTIESRVQFFDAQQAPVEGPTAWQRLHLPPQSVNSYTEASATIVEPRYYYIEVREAK